MQTSRSVLIRLIYLLTQPVCKQTAASKTNTTTAEELIHKTKCFRRFSRMFLCRRQCFPKREEAGRPSADIRRRWLDIPSEQYVPHVTISSREMLPGLETAKSFECQTLNYHLANARHGQHNRWPPSRLESVLEEIAAEAQASPSDSRVRGNKKIPERLHGIRSEGASRASRWRLPTAISPLSLASAAQNSVPRCEIISRAKRANLA